ncbi:hypothetical protein C8R46DRAFT_63024 [Mycena filopes]|nr:hypothetical protein C8R46DRAFT_63024 [Mycena filopes]
MVEDAKYMEIVLDTTDTRLTTTDRLACLRGYTVLSKLQFTTTFAWLALNGEPPFKLCAQRKICMKGINEIYGGVSGSKSALWIIGYWKDSWDKHLCSACRKKAKEVYEAGRKANWEQLPAAFGLPKWAELKSMDFE